MTEYTYQPNNDGQWPDDTVSDDTTVATMGPDDLDEVIRQIKSATTTIDCSKMTGAPIVPPPEPPEAATLAPFTPGGPGSADPGPEWPKGDVPSSDVPSLHFAEVLDDYANRPPDLI